MTAQQLVVLAGVLLGVSPILSLSPLAQFSYFGFHVDNPSSAPLYIWDQRNQELMDHRSSIFDKNDRSLATVNGIPSSPKSFTYTALIGYGPVEDKKFGCAGSVISARFILSTAYCAQPRKSIGPARWVHVGDVEGLKSEDNVRSQNRRIVARFVHPDRRPPEVYHDIALFKIDRNLIFNPWVQPLCLHRAKDIPEGPATLTGWGSTALASPQRYHLLDGEVALLNDTECQQLYPIKNSKIPRGIDSETMFCAGQLGSSMDGCQSDAGGPLVLPLDENCFTVQIGISSYGDLCGPSDTPAIYTRVSYYVPWIESVLYKYFEYK